VSALTRVSGQPCQTLAVPHLALLVPSRSLCQDRISFQDQIGSVCFHLMFLGQQEADFCDRRSTGVNMYACKATGSTFLPITTVLVIMVIISN
jgi:hypothetical protein